MRKILLGLIILLLSLTSCRSTNNEHIFSIRNGSSMIIDSIKVSSNVAEVTLTNIKPNESKSKSYVIMEESNYEGAFRAFIYFQDTTILVPSFGYFSNDRDVAKYLYLEIDKNLSVKEK